MLSRNNRRRLLVWFLLKTLPAGETHNQHKNQSQHDDAWIINQRDRGKLPELSNPATAIDYRRANHIQQEEAPAGPARQIESMHLRDHENTGKAKEKHWPEGKRVGKGYQCTVEQHKDLNGKCPVFIGMNPREKETALEQNHEHVEEADQMTRGIFHRMVPEGVNGSPREKVAVVFARELDCALR